MTEQSGWSNDDIERWRQARAEDERKRAITATDVVQTIFALLLPLAAYIWCVALMLRDDAPGRGRGIYMGIYAIISAILWYVAWRLYLENWIAHLKH